MAGAKKSTWIGATAFAAVLMIAAAWFLLVSPSFAHAADMRTQADQTRSQNDVLALKIAKLKSDFAKLPEYKTQLAELQKQIPADVDVADYLLQLNAIATSHNVTITEIQPSTAQPAALPQAQPAPQPTPAPSASASADASSTGTAAAPATPSSGLFSVQVQLKVLGTYSDTVAFLYDIQNSTPRLFLVTGFVGTSQKDAAAGGGKPATKEGDQELQIMGVTYILPTEADGTSTPTPTPTATPQLPQPPAGKDPLTPIQGS